MERGHQQRLSKAARTSQEKRFAIVVRQMVNIRSLVHIEIILLADNFKVLYAYRIKFICHRWVGYTRKWRAGEMRSTFSFALTKGRLIVANTPAGIANLLILFHNA